MDSCFGHLTENESKQNVVQLNIQKSHMFGCLKSLTLNNLVSSFVHVGHINIDVPLRPMIVHGVVYRESKVIEQKILPEIKNFAIFEEEKAGQGNAGVSSGGATVSNAEAKTTGDKIDTGAKPSAPDLTKKQQPTTKLEIVDENETVSSG